MRAHKAMVHFSAQALTAADAVAAAHQQFAQWEEANPNVPILQMSTSIAALPIAIDGQTQPGVCFIISILFLFLPG